MNNEKIKQVMIEIIRAIEKSDNADLKEVLNDLGQLDTWYQSLPELFRISTAMYKGNENITNSVVLDELKKIKIPSSDLTQKFNDIIKNYGVFDPMVSNKIPIGAVYGTEIENKLLSPKEGWNKGVIVIPVMAPGTSSGFWSTYSKQLNEEIRNRGLARKIHFSFYYAGENESNFKNQAKVLEKLSDEFSSDLPVKIILAGIGNAIIEGKIEPQIQAALEKCKEKGITVIHLIGTEIKNDFRIWFNQKKAGLSHAQRINQEIEKIGPKNSVVIRAPGPKGSYEEDRSKGFEENIRKDVKLITLEHGNWESELTNKYARIAIGENDLEGKVIFASSDNEEQGMGVISAINDLIEKSSRKYVLGMDGNPWAKFQIENKTHPKNSLSGTIDFSRPLARLTVKYVIEIIYHDIKKKSRDVDPVPI